MKFDRSDVKANGALASADIPGVPCIGPIVGCTESDKTTNKNVKFTVTNDRLLGIL